MCVEMSGEVCGEMCGEIWGKMCGEIYGKFMLYTVCQNAWHTSYIIQCMW